MSTPIYTGASSTAWSTAGNWSTAAVPVNSDTVVLTNLAIAVASGLSQSGVTLTALNIDQSYTGLVAASTPTYLNIGATTFNIGTSTTTNTTGSKRLNIQAANSGAIINVLNSATAAQDTNSTPIRLLTTAAVLNISGGIVGVALGTGETSTIATLTITQAKNAPIVTLGSGVTLTTGIIGGAGTLNNYSTASSTMTLADTATLNHLGTGGYGTLTIGAGCTVRYNGTGTITSLVNRGKIDFSQGFGAVTVTNATGYDKSKIIDPRGRVTWTNPIFLSQCAISDCTLNLGANRHVQVS